MVTVAGLRRIELSILHFPTTDFLLTGCLLKERVTERFKSFKTVQPPEVFLQKGFLKISSKFTGEHPCQSVISVRLQSNISA